MRKMIIGIITALLVVVVVIACGKYIISRSGFGAGNGSGEGAQPLSLPEENDKEEAKDNTNEIIIKVEENKIYIGQEECSDAEDLADKISKFNSEDSNIKFIFEHDNAIKSTYDEVRKTLIELEETLEINVDYTE